MTELSYLLPCNQAVSVSDGTTRVLEGAEPQEPEQRGVSGGRGRSGKGEGFFLSIQTAHGLCHRGYKGSCLWKYPAMEHLRGDLMKLNYRAYIYSKHSHFCSGPVHLVWHHCTLLLCPPGFSASGLKTRLYFQSLFMFYFEIGFQ